MNQYAASIFTISLFVTGVGIPISLIAFYFPVQFYHPPLIITEPRMQTDRLTTFECTISRGSTTHAFNHAKKKVPLFDIFGTHNLEELVPDSNEIISIGGKFRFGQLLFSFTQNMYHGFFFTFLAPLRRLVINSLNYSRLTDHQGPFFAPFDHALKKAGLDRHEIHTTGLADFLALIGCTYSVLDDPYVDFFDHCLQIGLLMPTSLQQQENNIFSLPLGFDGHWAFASSLNSSVGLYEWITAGICVDCLIFAPHAKKMRIKTNSNQCGMLFAMKHRVSCIKYPQFSCAMYLKADHVTRGLSIIGSYSYTYQGKTKIMRDNATDNDALANTDQRLDRWYVHAIHGAIEYDFTGYEDTIGPRVAIFYDKPLSGSHVFIPSLWSGTVGIDVCWQF